MTDKGSIQTKSAAAPASKEELCREWLGIKSRSPSYYGLLGVPELESDTTVIFHAGRHAKRKLRAYQIGQYRQRALDLLADIGQAVAVLTNPEKKRAYDRELLKRWKTAVEECYRAHCEGAAKDPAALEAWLTACALGGVPVARLLPAIVWSMGPRIKEWPAHGEHEVGLPVNLWIYRDAVILGQCLHAGSLEKRVEAVKNAQKLLGVSEGMARVIAEEVSRGLHQFAQVRLVVLAKKDPETLLVRLGRRIRRFGGRLGHRGKVLAAVATLLGKHKKDLDRAFDRLAEPAVELSAGQKAAHATRAARKRVREVRQTALGWVTNRPQILLGLGLLVGLAALVVASLVVTGVWKPWESVSAPPTSTNPAPKPPGGQAPAVGPKTPSERPVPEGPASLPPDDLEGLKEFMKKYPAGKGPPGEDSGGAVEPGGKPEKPPGGKTPTKPRFFKLGPT